MSVKYNSVGRLRAHGTGSAIVRWLALISMAGDAIAGFMHMTGDCFAGMLGAAAPVWAPARIRTCAK